ncbi:MAG TPA: adenosine-specific kinase [bacterium]|nr:adenosine-specific kinase [bacterium]
METHVVRVENPDGLNVILGQSHFVKTADDLHEALVGAVPNIRFGLAFCEASGPRLIRTSGTAQSLVELAARNAKALGCGHVFVLFLDGAFPINVLGAIRQVPEVCRIFCATANPLEVVVAETEQGRGVLGVIDGQPPVGVEGPDDVRARRELLRKFGYKL